MHLSMAISTGHLLPFVPPILRGNRSLQSSSIGGLKPSGHTRKGTKPVEAVSQKLMYERPPLKGGRTSDRVFGAMVDDEIALLPVVARGRYG